MGQGPVGSVSLSQRCSQSQCTGALNAFFGIDDGGFSNGAICTTTRTDGCEIVDCATSAWNFPQHPPGLNGGQVNVQAPVFNEAAVFQDPIDEYGSGTWFDRIWSGGDTLTASSFGSAAIPAFSGKSITAPADISLTAPSCDSTGHCGAISRSAPFTIAWSGAAAAVEVKLQTRSADRLLTITCPFSASPATVSAAVTSNLRADPSDAGVPGTTIDVVSTSSMMFSAGDFPILFRADSSAANGGAFLVVTP
jgi:hypothetical protein